MKALAAHIEAVADVAAERLVLARQAVRTARARYEQAKLQDQIRPDRESKCDLEIAEFDLWRCERAEKFALAKSTRDVSRSH